MTKDNKHTLETKQRCIERICDATGCTDKAAAAQLKKAKGLGISPFEYVRYEGWRLSDKQLEALAKKIKQIHVICNATEWNWEMAEAQLNQAKNLGIPNFRYVSAECWNKDEEKLQAFARKCGHVMAIVNASGWKWTEAEAHLDKAKALGIPNFRYDAYECWKLDDDNLEALAKKCKHIKAVVDASGWKWTEAEAHLDKAKSLGIPNFRYMPYACWKLTDADLTRLGKKSRHIKRTCTESGWKWEQAEAHIDTAKAYGIPNYKYVRNRCWTMTGEELTELGKVLAAEKAVVSKALKKKRTRMSSLTPEQQTVVHKAMELGISKDECLRKSLWLLNDEELQEFAKAVDQRRKINAQDREFYIDIVCKKAGWDRATAEEKINEAKEMGISGLKYAQKATWEKDEAEVDFLIRFLKADKRRIADNKKLYLSKICEKTGWSVAKAELEIAKAKAVSRASYEDFLAFRFWEVPSEKQKEFVTLGLFNKMNLAYNDHVIGRKFLDDKATFNTLFKDFIHRKWFTNWDLSYEDFLKHIEGLDRILAKPLRATQGIGIEKFNCNVSEEENRKIYEKLIAMPESIVEQFIIQNDEVKQFCDTSVNTVRVTTIHHNGKCDILYALFRSGRGGTVDNFHAGGVAAAVDVDTGIVCTNGADVNFDFYEIHPYSELKLKGFKLPHWDKIQKTCDELVKVIPEVSLIGWDFAITPDGIDLIEGNSGAYIVAQLLYASEGIGLRKRLVDPYLDLPYSEH